MAPVASAPHGRSLDVAAIREDFPILRRRVHGKPLVYLDNAATTQKPQSVIDRLVRYYSEENANIHRGVHVLSVEATDAYDAARETVRRFLNAADAREIVFVRGTTEAINLVAATYGRAHIAAGDEVVISEMEHHSNIVPWQMLCEEKGARLRVIPITDAGELRLDEYERLLVSERASWRSRTCRMRSARSTRSRTSSVSRTAAGFPCSSMAPRRSRTCRSTCRRWAAISTSSPDTRCSARPGSACSTAERRCSTRCRPYQGGGDMIRSVTFERTLYNELPYKFEAGTPNIAGVRGARGGA